ncbi:IMV surface protein [Yokapox virus]|uniref:IMV surface protein n=1 Tax=Yokapox virus TaxID=1076255 RepID=G3EI23_9POXV|nr:IMV surface protein [Yokapox virus]AEN03720.1 IMV surface protein [Yokapox virus]
MEEVIFPGDDDLAIKSDELYSLKINNLAASKDDIDMNDRLTNIEKKLNNITVKFSNIEKCCNKNEEVIYRLENHAETLRLTMLTLAKKIDIQTGREPYDGKI